MMMARKAFFRADASASIGTGHIMRCLTLADALKKEGFEAIFLCRMLEGHMADYIERRGYNVCRIQITVPLSKEDSAWDAEYTGQVLARFDTYSSWLIVDHYAIDSEWESTVKPLVGFLLVIDDLANRPHIADALLDQNVCDNARIRYEGLVPAGCRLLLGPQYLLLRKSFYLERQRLRLRPGTIRRILVFFGGSDPTDETSKVLDALSSIVLSDIQLDVVVGQANSRISAIERRCQGINNIKLHVQAENMAELIAGADFSLGSGGVAMWERCYLGLPSAVTAVADNQVLAVKLADRLGAIWSLGWHEQINSGHYADILHKALTVPLEILTMSSKALELMDSHAETADNRVLKALLEER
jgi:UDP-2,4-diacetamido-2,4,6-trideoxy-beta-L-altropyranose hydrolase